MPTTSRPKGAFVLSLLLAPAYGALPTGVEVAQNVTASAARGLMNRWDSMALIVKREAKMVARKVEGWWESTSARVLLATLAALKVVDWDWMLVTYGAERDSKGKQECGDGVPNVCTTKAGTKAHLYEDCQCLRASRLRLEVERRQREVWSYCAERCRLEQLKRLQQMLEK